MKPVGKRHKTIPWPFGGGMFSAGDPTTIPDGTVRSMRNYSVRPDGGGARLDCRAPFVYDGLDTISGFAVWQDLVNEVTKTVAVRSTDQKIYTKNTTGLTYGAGVSGLPSSTRLTSYTNFLQKLYMMFDNGAGVPTATATWDGTTLVTAPFNTTIVSRTVTAFISRLFLCHPRVQVLNQFFADGGSLDPYSWTQARWVLTSCSASSFASGGTTTTCRVTPSATSGAKAEWGGTGDGTGITSQKVVVWRQDLRNTSSSYSMPFTMEVFINRPNWAGTTAFVVGNIIVDSNGNLQRCTTAGTSGGGAPAWATTVGATTADGAPLVWTCDGSSIIGSSENFLPVNTSNNWYTFYCTGTLAPRGTATTFTIGCRFKFGNTLSSTITLAGIDVSYKDGLTDGDPRKQNYGAQLTFGDSFFPFFNYEAASFSNINIDAVIWSEINNPKQILAKNTYPLSEIAGIATTSMVCDGRLVVAKRKGMWIFKGVPDINEPILPETVLPFGIIGPQAVDVARDKTMYFIGEQHVCSMKIGDASPKFLDSPGMYEEIMARGANWVESQSTYNMPLLAIDHANRDVWVYTQKGKIYIYNIDTATWGYYDTNPTGTAAEVQAMMFDPVGNRMVVSWGGASATRFDETSDATDSIVTGGATPWNLQSDLILKPFELFAPRYEATLLELGLYHIATIQQGSLTPSYSINQGSTFTTPSGYPITTYLTANRIRLPLAVTGPSATIKLARTGAGGKRNWSVSKLDALLRVHRGEIPYTNAT